MAFAGLVQRPLQVFCKNFSAVHSCVLRAATSDRQLPFGNFYGMAAYPRARDLALRYVQMQMNEGRAAHFHALLDQHRMMAVDQAVEKLMAPERAATAEPVAGSSARPMPGANIRA